MNAPLTELQSHLQFQLDLLRLTGCVHAAGKGERPQCAEASDLEHLAEVAAEGTREPRLPN